jgi:hypothetical protein
MDCLSCPTLLIDIGGAREGKSMRESSAGFKLLLMEETLEPKLRLLSGGGNSLLDFKVYEKWFPARYSRLLTQDQDSTPQKDFKPNNG